MKIELEKTRYISIAVNETSRYIVSTSMHAENVGNKSVPTYSSVIWSRNKNRKKSKLGKILKEYSHASRVDAISFHFRLCQTLTYRHLKEKMPNDETWAALDHEAYYNAYLAKL